MKPVSALSAARTAAAIVAIAALALPAVACSGGSSSTDSGRPSAASGSSTAGGSAGSSLLAYARCMRSHSVPNFPDPLPNSSSAKFPDAQQLGVSGSVYQAAEGDCEHLLPAGSEDQFPAAEVPLLLRGMLRFSQCVRSHGVPNWPDPTVDSQGHPGFNLVGIRGLNVDSAQVQAALNGCQHLLPSQLGGIPVSQS